MRDNFWKFCKKNNFNSNSNRIDAIKKIEDMDDAKGEKKKRIWSKAFNEIREEGGFASTCKLT